MYNVHVLSNMNVTFKQKRIIITFDKTCEITEILQSIYFYKSSTNFNITKILLKTKKYDTIWVNDLTKYLKTPLLFLWARLMSEININNDLEQTNIYNSDLNETSTIEIFMLTEVTNTPQFKPKEEFIQLIFNEWVAYTK